VFDLPTSPKLSWISLSLLFLTYATFGWLLYEWTNDREIWLLVAVAITLIGLIVTYPSRSIALGFGGLFRTDVRALILILAVSLLSVILLTWLHFFVDALVLFAAGLLVSLDLKVRGWRKVVILFVIIGWQLLGLSTGLGSHYFYVHPLANLPAFFYTDYWSQLFHQLKL
jgi:hypothetical protein